VEYGAPFDRPRTYLAEFDSLHGGVHCMVFVVFLSTGSFVGWVIGTTNSATVAASTRSTDVL
jgi:hypothetical protein